MRVVRGVCVLSVMLAFAMSPMRVMGATKDPPCKSPIKFEKPHAALQKNLEKALSKAGFDRVLKKRELAVAVADLTNKDKLYYAGVNDNVMMYAASLPKIAILLTVVEEVAANRIAWKHEFDQRLQNMIVSSSNTDASWGTDLVGLFAIENVMRNPNYCFYDDTHGGLWVGRAYRKGGAANRDPLHNISHGATARQAARFYAMLNAGYLVSQHWSFRMLGLMSPPRHFHKFVGGLQTRGEVVFLARKSGSWRNYHSDSALIQSGNARYVVIGISELKQGEAVMRELAVVVDDLMRSGAHRVSKKKRGR